MKVTRRKLFAILAGTAVGKYLLPWRQWAENTITLPAPSGMVDISSIIDDLPPNHIIGLPPYISFNHVADDELREWAKTHLLDDSVVHGVKRTGPITFTVNWKSNE